MEILKQVANAQVVFTAAVVSVVLVCAALVFVFGFRSAEPPQFDKLPLVLDDKKSAKAKNKKKEKKSSPNRSTSDDVKTKADSSKKSPSKEKKEEKVKEADKPKPKEKSVEPKLAKKEAVIEKKNRKNKAGAEVEKPADFDDGNWEEVPKKNDKKGEKKKVKAPEEKQKEKEKKKESPIKKVKKAKDTDVEAARPNEDSSEKVKIVSVKGPNLDANVTKALQEQVKEFERAMKEAQRRDQGIVNDEGSNEIEELTDVKDLRSNKKKENKEKQIKKKAGEIKADSVEKENLEPEKQEENQNAPAFDELGDTWTESKTSKKGKKKARKDQ